MEKKITYTKTAVAVINVLKEASDGLTLSEISAATGLDVKSGTVVALVKRGNVAVIGSREIERPTIKKINSYTYVGVAADTDVKLTETEQKVLPLVKELPAGFVLADLAKAMGKDKITSGYINGLVKKGFIEKAGVIEVPTTTKSEVNVYGFVADIPADAAING